MKTHKKREGGDAEGDQSMTVADVGQSYRKEKKKILPLMACNSEVEEDGNEQAAMDDNEEMEKEERKDEKLKRKVKTADVMMSDEKQRKEEKKKKKEKREQIMLSDDKGTKVEKKKKRIGDAVVKRSELRSDDMKADDEGDKGEKGKKRKRKEKERKGDKAVHEEQNMTNDMKEKKKGKRDQIMVLDDKETKVDAVVSGNEGREVEQNKLGDDLKADDEGNKGKKEKKRKEKETKGDVVLHEVQNTVNDKKENRKGKVNEMEGGKADNKEKKRKEKETKDGMVAGHEELIKVKEEKAKKKEKVKEMEAGKPGKAEKPEVKRDEMQKSKKRASAADSSEHVIPKHRSKKVKFLDEVTVFSPPDERKKVKSKKRTSNDNDECKEMLGKRFMKEEDELILKAVVDYIEAKQLGEEGLGMVLRCGSHREVRDCWKEIRKALPWRDRSSIYNRAHSLLERGDGGTWTLEQVELVMESYKKHGANWKAVAEELGKFRIHVKDAFRRYKLANRKKGHWSQDEYQTLFELVNKDLQMKVFEERRSKHGMLKDDISWEAISDKLGTRNQVACLQKWYNQLRSPMVAEGKWADVDDYWLLMELVELDASCEEEVDWDCLLEHRSGDICRKRWTQMTLHLGEHGNKSFSEQVEVLSNRYCPELLETREKLDARPIVD